MLVSVGGSGHTGHAASVAMGEGIGKDRIEFGGYFSHDPLYEGLQCSQRIFWKSAVSLFLFSLSFTLLISSLASDSSSLFPQLPDGHLLSMSSRGLCAPVSRPGVSISSSYKDTRQTESRPTLTASLCPLSTLGSASVS